MRKFTVCAPGCARQDLAAWESEGFKAVDLETGAAWENKIDNEIDVIFWFMEEKDSEANWQLVRRLLPKLYIIAGIKEAAAPFDLSEIYERQVIAGEGVYFTVGSKLQGKVAEPAWEACRAGTSAGGPLSRPEQIKIFAGSVYRYLLQDVFRETAEWCGHMSSVVGPM